ncbi:MAG: hypothetical protein Fur0010_13070 [Bdellovibrio sp.]
MAVSPINAREQSAPRKLNKPHINPDRYVPLNGNHTRTHNQTTGKVATRAELGSEARTFEKLQVEIMAKIPRRDNLLEKKYLMSA